MTITFRAADVPGVGYRSYLVRPSAAAPDASWQPAGDTTTVENAALLVRADPARGGTLAQILDKRTGTELLSAAGGGNELLLQPEHPAHPRWAEGPWLLCPAGPPDGAASRPAAVTAERCPVGSRLVARFELGGLRVTQETVLWDGADRVEFRTHVDGSIGHDHLLRVAFPASVPGGLPVFQTAVSVIGRPPGDTDIDVAEHSYTLDTPANEWFGVGSTARVSLPDGDGGHQLQAIGVAEVVCPPPLRAVARDLLVALARQGVTATCSVPAGPRYGYLELDSNLPDFRLSLGGPEENEFTASVLAAAGSEAADAFAAQAAGGAVRLWLPAARSRADAFGPGADLRGPLDLPVLIVAGPDTAAEAGRVIDDLADSVIEARPAAGSGVGGASTADDRAGGAGTALAGHSVAVLNRGTPSGLVTPAGTLTMALMRACSTWPCGVWIDGDKRTTPDGTSFAWQHWSHTFEYALAAGPGDWRSAGFAPAGQDYNHDLLTTVTGLHGGPLPASTALAAVEPASVLLSALKPFGNPLAPAAQPEQADGITVRLRDIGGTGPQEARVALHSGLASAHLAALCEDAIGEPLPVRDGAAAIPVPAAGVATAVLGASPLPGHLPPGTVLPGVVPGTGPESGSWRVPVPGTGPAARRAARLDRPSRSSPATGCTARARRPPGTCRYRCTCRRPNSRSTTRGPACSGSRRPAGRPAGPAGSSSPRLTASRSSRPARCATSCRRSGTRCSTSPCRLRPASRPAAGSSPRGSPTRTGRWSRTACCSRPASRPGRRMAPRWSSSRSSSRPPTTPGPPSWTSASPPLS